MKPSLLAEELKFLITSRRPVFIWGKPGVGKSSVVAQVAASMKRKLNDVRMSQLDSIDLRGFPIPDMKTKKMEWLPADFLPCEGDPPGVLFLDEMNGAMPAVASAGYQLILDHRIGSYILPKNWSIVAAGNNYEDRGITHQMPAPLNNRFIHLNFDIDSDDWHHQAASDGIDPRVRAYLRLKTGSLHVYDATLNPRSFPTPRTWYVVDEILKANRPPAAHLELLKGTVGEGAAAEFMGFCRDIEHMPNIDEIMMDPKKAPLPGSQSVIHAVVTTLGDRVKPANFQRIMDYVTRLEKEFQVVFVRSALKRERGVANVKTYIDWALANQHVIN